MKVNMPVVGLHAYEDCAARLVREQTSSHCLSGIHLYSVGSVAVVYAAHKKLYTTGCSAGHKGAHC